MGQATFIQIPLFEFKSNKLQMADNQNPNIHADSAAEIYKYEYKREIGSYRPKFQSVPQDYYPLTCCQVVKYAIIVLLATVFGLGPLIGFIYWVLKTGLNTFIIVWVCIFMVVFAIMIVLIYSGGKARITEEKRIIEESRQKQQVMRNKERLYAQSNGQIQVYEDLPKV